MSIIKCNSARNFLVSSRCFDDTTTKDLKETTLRDFGINPVGCAVLITAKVLIYTMAAEHAGKVCKICF